MDIKQKVIKVEDIKKDAEEMQCPVEKSLYLISVFLKGPMCGRCFPCSMGCYEAKIILKNMIAGNSSIEELENLKRIANEILISALCKKGKDTAQFILEWIDTGDFDKHIEGICPEQVCPEFIEYRIISDKCTMCGDCLRACKLGAISGEEKKQFISGYQPFEIRQTKCTKCGECIKVCTEKAIILLDVKSKETVEV
jgi:ferredoxin